MSAAEPTGFLYPFIEAEERDAGALVTDLVMSARAKMEESACFRADTLERCAEQVERAGVAMGTASPGAEGCSASGTVAARPMPRGRRSCSATPRSGSPLPALSLVDDQAVLTALSNDVGFELVFSRQLIAHAGGTRHGRRLLHERRLCRTCCAPSRRRRAGAS